MADLAELARAKLCPRDPSVCRHLECEMPAQRHVVTPFGTGNFCSPHAEEIGAEEHGDHPGLFVTGAFPMETWLRDCFRYSFDKDDHRDAPIPEAGRS